MSARHVRAVCRLVVVMAALVGQATVAHAQNAPVTAPAVQSPISDLLVRAAVALNDLRYRDALTVGREVLALGSRVSRDEERQALRIIAAAQFPEERDARDPAGARQTLAQLIRHDPSARIPRGISWRGLDSLADVVRRETFGAMARLPREVPLTGADSGALSVELVTNRPALASLRLSHDASGRVVQWASESLSTTAAPMLGVPSDWVRAGPARLDVVWVSGSDTVRTTFGLRLDGVSLQLMPVADTLRDSERRAEREPPRRWRDAAVVTGAVAATLLSSSFVRASEPVRSAAPRDRFVGAAAGLVLVAGAAATVADRGRVLADNVQWNRETAATRRDARTKAMAENAQRRAAWSATLVVEGERR